MSQRPPLAALVRELSERERHSPRDERVRLAARLRARDACEYCLFPADGQFQVDHIIPVARWDLYAANRLRAVGRIPG